MGEVVAYVKNQSLGFTIPYTINGIERQYYPDFLVRINDGDEREEPLNLVLEVTGERKKDKEAKTATARTLWIPAVNHHGGFGAGLSWKSPTRTTTVRTDPSRGSRRGVWRQRRRPTDGTQEERPDPRVP